MAAPRLSDEEKDRLAGGEAAAKKAARQPKGDEELSGAAPGIKAKDADPDDVESFDQPASARRAQRRADKRMDEVRDIQRDVQSRNLLENVPPENVQTVFGTKTGNKDPDSVTFVHAGGGVTLMTSSNEVTFNNRDDALSLVRAANQIAANL
jgi:hypothetical protein